MNFRLLFREMMHSRGQAVIFVLCVALSLISIVAVSSFRRDVRSALADDARSLHGGDIIVRSQAEFSPPLGGELAALQEDEGIAVVRNWEFYSMARRADGEAALFSNIKVVEKGYPLYGTVELQSGRPFSDVLQSGRAVVGASLLDRLGVEKGDTLLLGDARLTIVDVVGRESLRPVDFFSFGPRIFVAAEDLARMNLIGKGSRVSYVTTIKVSDPGNVDGMVERLKAAAAEGRERVATAATAGSRVKRFLDNLLSFLALVSVFTLLLAGIGIQSSLAALLRRKVKSLAIIRSLGATSSFLLRHYLALVVCLGLLGCGLGIVAGLALKQSFAGFLGGFLPENIDLGVTLTDVIEGTALGLAVVAFFTFLPLSATLEVKPAAIFRKEKAGGAKRASSRMLLALGLLLLAGLVVLQLEELRTGLYFVGGMLGLIGLLAALAGLLMAGIARLRVKRLSLRQAVRSLLRPGNATLAIVVTLASALAVLLSMYLVERNLRANYIDSYPSGAPNLFCLDIQPDQRQGFLELVGGEAELFPVVRARLRAINGEKIDSEAERETRGDSLAREFNLTYRETLLSDEILVEGPSLFGTRRGEDALPPVSLLDTVVEMGGMKIGDVLEFNVQGVPLKAQVTSIRKHTGSMLFPYFYFVFPEQYLKAAPQTMFAALRVPEGEVAQLENRIVGRYPNISPINVGETAAEFGRILTKLSTVVRFFAAFSLLAGALILMSSILATRMARMEEAVYYKILGAGSSFVLRVFLLENLLLALFCGGCGLLAAQLGSWAVCRYFLEIGYRPYWPACLALLAATVGLVVILGLLSSAKILSRKPARFLREQG